MQSSKEKLGTEKISKLLFSMGFPAVVAQIVNLLYNIVDRIYIGHIPDIGTNALTGVGLTMPIIIIVSAFSAFVGGGGAPLASIALGEGDKKRAERILANGFLLLVIFTVILVPVIFIIKKWALYKIGASDATFGYADDYLSVYLMGTFFVLITVGLNTFITAQGKSGTAMVSVIIGAIINIILDPILIYVFDMGVKGAAVATVFSQFCSAAWVLAVLFRKDTYLRIKFGAMRPDIRIMVKIAGLGISPFIMQATESFVTIALNHGLKVYGGDIYVGSLTVLQSVMQIITVPIGGFTTGTQPIISYNYGAGNRSRVKKSFGGILAVSMAYTVPLTLFAIIFPGVFAGIFSDDPALISIIVKVLPIFISGMLVFGLQMTCQHAFLGMGQAKFSIFIALLRKVILLIPLAILLPKITGNVMGIYFAEPISDTVSALTCTVLFLTNFNKILDHRR